MNNIDERVVAMRFDNNQFERGVRTSMRSLEELKEKSNLDDVASSIGESMSSINDALNFKSPTKSAGIFSKALTSMGKVAKYTFKSLTSPLRVLSNSLQTLGKYTRTMFGIDLANDIINAGKQIVRAFTIDPLRAGWSEYELKMDSIKTIMSGSGESLETVKEALEQLNTYADQTIYSFSDMTSNIGKFTNNGVKLEDAVTAMKGISNAAADAGQGTNQASMAMYNLSQAISMGKLTTIDWKSIENANMATLKFKQTIIDAGVAMGQLKKEGDKYYTTSADKSEVTAENFRNTLEKGWATTDVLLTALKVYSGELNAVELAALGFDLIPDDLESDAYRLEKLGQEAYSAATEVRTFTKMMDALKEAAQSGWAMTFEYIFGDMQEATDLWTKLNNRFDKILSAQTESRNDILKGWRGFKKQWSEDGKSFEWIPIEGAEDGREILIEGFNNLLDTVQSIAGLVGDAWKNVFGELTSDKLLTFTKRFTDFTKKFKSWLNSGNQNGTRLEKIRKGLEGIFSVFKNAWTSIKNTFTTIVNTLHLDQVFDLAIDGFAAAGEWLTDIGGKISKLWDDIGGNQVLENLSNWFGDLWTNIGKFFTEPDEATGKTGFLSWWDGMISDLEAKWTKLQATDFYKAATTLGTNLWENIFGFFQPKERYDERGIRLYDNRSPFQEMLDNIGEWLTSAKTTIETEWKEFTGSSFYTNVTDWFSNTFDKIIEFFSPKDRYDERGIKLYNNDSPFIATIKGAIDSLSTWWEGVKSNEFVTAIATFFTDLYNSISGFVNDSINIPEGKTWEDTPIGKVVKSVEKWLSDAWTWINSNIIETPFVQGIVEFVTDTWNWILKALNLSGKEEKKTSLQITDDMLKLASAITMTDFRFEASEKVVKDEGWKDSPVGKAIMSVYGWLQQAWNWINENIVGSELVQFLVSFVTDTWNWIMETISGSGIEKSTTSPDTEEKPEEINSFTGFLQSVFTSLEPLLETAKSFINWEGITNLFDTIFEGAGQIVTAFEKTSGITTLSALFSAIGEIIGVIKDVIVTAGSTAFSDDGSFWTDLSTFVGIIFNGANQIIQTFLAAAGITSLSDAAQGIVDVLTVLSGFLGLISGIIVDISGAISGFMVGDNDKTVASIIDAIKKLAQIVVIYLVMLTVKHLIKGDAKETSVDILKHLQNLFTMLVDVTVIVGWIFATGLALFGLMELLKYTFGDDVGDKIAKDLEDVGNIFTEIMSGLGALFGGLIGAGIGEYKGQKQKHEIERFTEGLKYAAQVGKDIKAEDIKHVETLIEMLTGITKKLPDRPGDLSRWFGTTQMTIGDVGDNLSRLAAGFADFNGVAESIPDIDKVSRALNAIANFSRAAVSVALLGELGKGEYWDAYDIVSTIMALLYSTDDVVRELTDSGFEFDSSPLITLAESINQEAQEAADNISFQPIIDKLLSEWERVVYTRNHLDEGKQEGSSDKGKTSSKLSFPEGTIFVASGGTSDVSFASTASKVATSINWWDVIQDVIRGRNDSAPIKNEMESSIEAESTPSKEESAFMDSVKEGLNVIVNGIENPENETPVEKITGALMQHFGLNPESSDPLGIYGLVDAYKNENGVLDIPGILGIDTSSPDPLGLYGLVTPYLNDEGLIDIGKIVDVNSLDYITEQLSTKLGAAIANGISKGFYLDENGLVFDFSDLDNMPLFSFQDGNLTFNGAIKIDTSSLDGVVSAINTQGGRIVGAINGLGGKIDTLHSAMSQMQLVLDTGAVAGAVSSNIQKSSAVYRRVDIRDTSGGR